MRAKIALCAGSVMFALTPGAIPSSAADGVPAAGKDSIPD